VLAAVTVLAGMAGVDGAVGASAATGAPAGTKPVSYLGYHFDIPAAWPVIRLGPGSSTCVKFDRHVVYLGTPGSNENCPSWLLGATEAMVVQPGPAAARSSSVEDPVSREITVTARRITVVATFDADPTVIYRILASARLPAPLIKVPDPTRMEAAGESGAAALPAADSVAAHTVAADTVAADRARRRDDARRRDRAGRRDDGARRGPGGKAKRARSARQSVPAPVLPASVANYRGLGFDSCTAPSSQYMSAWLHHSPYRAVGIYIGGADRACDQPNLTAAWVRHEASAGWRFLPLYVGPQAEFDQLSAPKQQGRNAASDAVAQAQRLGFGPATPIYYDMEAYSPHHRKSVLRFLSAWTTRLHQLGYLSGVYSSADSGIANLAQEYGNHSYVMPDVIDDARWNGARDTSDRVLSRHEWAGHRRIHQFSGNVVQRYGGKRIDIDQDYFNVRLAEPGGTDQSTSAVVAPGGDVYVCYQGTDNRLWADVYSGKSWSAPIDLGGRVASQPSVVAASQNDLDVFYQAPGGHLWVVMHTPSGWTKPAELRSMGKLGGPPKAIAQPNGVVDVFWQGSGNGRLWHGQFSPGSGWTGPQDLGGSLAGAPSPVETKSGQVQVYWAGQDGNLWRAVRPVGGRWSSPSNLGMGRLSGPVDAVALSSGTVDVFWRAATSPHRLLAASVGSGKPTGPLNLGGRVSYAPWPVDAGGTVQVYFRGRDIELWQVASSSSTAGWTAPGALPMGPLDSGPFAAVPSSAGSGTEHLFWAGPGGALWTAALNGSTWAGPTNLGGAVG
jgi:hypothetical protein